MKSYFYFQNNYNNMDSRDISKVCIQTKDGLEEISYSDCEELVSSYIDLIGIGDHSSLMHHLVMPDVTSASIRNLISLLRMQFSIAFNMEEVRDIKDCAIMLRSKLVMADLVVKKYQCSDDSATNDIFIISCGEHCGVLEGI